MPCKEAVFPADFFGENHSVFGFDAMNKQVHSVLSDASEVYLYATGLTVALCAVINYCAYNHVPLTIAHYDREKGSYVEQRMATDADVDLLREAGYIR